VETSYIITFIGDDRPGLVEQLSTVIEENQGNWHESQLSQLGGKFAGLVRVSIREDSAEHLESALKALSVSGLSVRLTPTSAGQSIPAARKITLNVIGPDRLGIVREISQALTNHQVNVVEMDSQVTSAPMSAEMLFHARIDAEIPPDTNLDDLSDMLDEIANQMTLDISLDSV
jgi:glycine cleavage system regulatory protein